MTLWELVRCYDSKTNVITFEMEIGNSFGNCDFSEIYLASEIFEQYVWIEKAERFSMDYFGYRIGHSHIANKDLDRIERFIYEIFEEELTEDMYWNDMEQRLFTRLVEKENAHREKHKDYRYVVEYICRGKHSNDEEYERVGCKNWGPANL